MLPTKIYIFAEKYGLQLKVQGNDIELLLPTVKKQKKPRLHILQKSLSWVKFFGLQVLLGYTTMLLLGPENL